MHLHFKIQSVSSQFHTAPASNLLSRNGHWQSQRFCDYPQLLTLSFHQPVLLKSIKIVAHPTKVPSRINILYHLNQHEDKGYLKYGYLTFSEPQDAAVNSQVKQISDVGIKATQIRFILLKNYQNKSNFFNQIGICALQFTGENIDHVLPALQKTKNKGFETQATLLMQLKQSYVKRQQFQQAKQIKEMQMVLERANEQIFQLQRQKQKCVKQQDFNGAKKIRDELIKLREKVTDLASKFYDPHGQIRMIKSDIALKQKIQEMNLTSKSFSNKGKSSRHKTNQDQKPLQDVGQVQSEGQNEGQEEDKIDDGFDQSMLSYDDRIVPAVISKMRGSQPNPILEASQMGDNQFFDSAEKNNLPQEPQTMGPADQANSSLLLDFYQPIFIRKLHSKYWQFRLQSITQATQQLQANHDPNFLSKQRLRCFLFIYLTILKTPNFKTTSAVLEMMDLLSQAKSQSDFHKELHNQLEAAMRATLKVLNDSNHKIRIHAEKTVLRMIQSSVFGVHACYTGIIKNYPQKGVPRLRKIRLENLIHLVGKYGIGEHAVPHSIADFAQKASNDPESDVRKSAVELSRVVKEKGGKTKLQSLLGQSRARSNPKY